MQLVQTKKGGACYGDAKVKNGEVAVARKNVEVAVAQKKALIRFQDGMNI